MSADRTARDDFVMDPQFDDLIGGDRLRDGMIVRPERRSEDTDPREREWCTVTELVIESVEWPGYPRLQQVRFIGVYTDGTKRSHAWNVVNCWFVKKDTMPEDQA